MGAITQAVAKTAESRGVEIQVCAPVRETILEAGADRRLERGWRARRLPYSLFSFAISSITLYMSDQSLAPWPRSRAAS